MQKFESPLVLYLNNKIDLVATCAAIREWATAQPDTEIIAAAAYLSELYDSHQIGEHVQKKILQALHHNRDTEIEFGDDDETVFSTPVDISDDATVIAVPDRPADSDIDEDATALAPGLSDDGDATVIASSSDRDATAMASINDDIDTSFYDKQDDDELGPGSILKDRFNLVSILGEGGMGRVYKAIDMLKVEAKDNNPYVAIKLLTGDFKEHPDAFIALQRETSKAQKLAHPNISTVYDFDRHKETVYMTMELLEGIPLDDYIKRLPEGGLEVDHALSIVHDLGEGLAYAHKQGLVHSDFKPGNAFLLDDGSVKVIDFGIARAAALGTDSEVATGPTSAASPAYTSADSSITGQSTAGTMTDDIFDAGTLGALTPAYATIEMFEGFPPHPSDDIYALACVAVQLLTGKHPFNKKSAPKAKKARLKPPVIEGLTKRQQRALDKALAFDRKDRTETMEEFLDEIRKRKSYVKQIALGTVSAIVIIAALAYKPVTDYYENQEIEQIILNANSGSDAYLRATLDSLDSYPPQKRATIKFGIRDRALQLYLSEIDSLVDFDKEIYKFDEAQALTDEALTYYPDSSVIKDLRQKQLTGRKQNIKLLEEAFYTQLLAKNFYPDPEREDMSDVLRRLSQLDADNESFKDPRLEDGYYLGGIASLKNKDYARAMTYFTTGARYLPDSRLYANQIDATTLARLSDNVNSAINTVDISADNTTLEDYKTYLDELMILSLPVGIQNPQYTRFTQTFETGFNTALLNLDNSARKQLVTFTRVLPIDKIIAYSEKAGDIADSKQTQPLPALDFITADSTVDVYAGQMSKLRQIIAAQGNAALTQYNLDYAAVIEPLAEQQRYQLIDFYNRIYRPLFIDETISNSETVMKTARNAYQQTLASTTLMSEIENDKRIFRNIASQNRLDDSIQTYNKIAKNSDDTEFLDYARGEIARMYLTLAASSATEEEFDKALNYATKANTYVEDERTAELMKDYRKEVIVASIPALVVSQEDEKKQEAIKALAFLKKNHPDDYPFFLNRIAALINEDIIILASENILLAHKLKDHALSIVNSRIIRKVNIKPLPEPSKLALRGKIEVSQHKLTTAQATLKQAKTETPGHYQVDEFETLLDEALAVARSDFSDYRSLYANEKYYAADSALKQAIENWKDNPTYLQERQYYDRILRQVRAKAKLCREDIQGLGKQSRGICKDTLLTYGGSAPTLVVVPAKSTRDKPYAIGKYEISTGELNTFCRASAACNPLESDNVNLPAVDVPLDIIDQYTDWLTQQTGFTYSLATKDEWFNAASAGGREGNTNYNCRLRLGVKLIKGQNIVPVQSGTANNWGLINYVGNVDELVKTEDGYVMAGGNFTDSISDCKVSLIKPVETDQDYTGFRLVRSLY